MKKKIYEKPAMEMIGLQQQSVGRVARFYLSIVRMYEHLVHSFYFFNICIWLKMKIIAYICPQ